MLRLGHRLKVDTAGPLAQRGEDVSPVVTGSRELNVSERLPVTSGGRRPHTPLISGGTRVQKMSPAAERLVRLMLLLPSDPREPLWKSATDDCGDLPTVMSIGGWVRDTAKM